MRKQENTYVSLTDQKLYAACVWQMQDIFNVEATVLDGDTVELVAATAASLAILARSLSKISRILIHVGTTEVLAYLIATAT